MNTQTNEKIIEEISNYLKKLNIWARLLQSLTILLTLTIITTSLMIGFLVEENINDILIKAMAFLTTFCTVSMSALNLEKKAYDMREAYRYLKNATYKYRTGEYDISTLVDAYYETEKTIGHVEINEETISRFKNIRR
ncbi:MAG: hypothetical protein WBF90_10395 [Rivularia sp. (in: cyanobacteria)]